MRNSNGVFSLIIKGLNRGNDETSSGKRFGLDRIFQNRGKFEGLPDCVMGEGEYSPNPADGRRFVVSFRDETMTHWEPLPEMMINYVPMALDSRSVGGYNASHLLRVDDPDPQNVNVQPLSVADVTELRALLDGTSEKYMQRSDSGVAILPSFPGGGAPGSPQAGSIWYDSDAGVIRFYDGTTTQTLGTGTGSGTVTAITVGDGLLLNGAPGGTLTSSGTISLDTITTPGKVSGDAIITGTIGGDTVIDITGSISTSGSVTSGSLSTRVLDLYDLDSSNRIRFQAPASLATDYTLTWPQNLGSAGQVLGLDGSGNLTWISSLTTALNSGQILVGNGSNVATPRTPSGDLSMDNSGSFTVTRIQGSSVSNTTPVAGQVLKFSGGSWVPSNFGVADLKNSSGTQQFPTTACGSHQTLAWNSLTDTFTCSNIAIDEAAVTFASKTKNTVFAAPNGADGAPSFRALVSDDIPNLDWSKITTGKPTTVDGYGITDAVINGGNSGVVTVGTNDASNLTLETNNSARMTITSGGNVGVGRTSPSAKLEIAGQVRAVNASGVAHVNNTASVDWNNGNAQELSVACTSTTFSNMLDGGTYILAVTETGGTQCNFSHSGLTFYYSPANGPRTAGKRTVYTFQRIGDSVYVSWIKGFE